MQILKQLGREVWGAEWSIEKEHNMDTLDISFNNFPAFTLI